MSFFLRFAVASHVYVVVEQVTASLLIVFDGFEERFEVSGSKTLKEGGPRSCLGCVYLEGHLLDGYAFELLPRTASADLRLAE